METALIVALVVVGLFLFLALGTNFGRDPSTKTLPQLKLAERLHAKRVDALGPSHPKYEEALAEMQRVTDEIRKREQMMALDQHSAALTNSTLKLKANVEMFRQGISAHRLSRNAVADDLHYYIGYITALARAIAVSDGVRKWKLFGGDRATSRHSVHQERGPRFARWRN